MSFDTARDFIELVVPELRKRGRYRESYQDGQTLRERLFGHSRLSDDHFGARYRDPNNLQRPPVERLQFEVKERLAHELSMHEFRERALYLTENQNKPQLVTQS